jgi:hypothetical protein
MKNSTTIIILVIIVIIFMFIFMGYSFKENFYYKTPYPRQCPSIGADLSARNIDAPYVRSEDQVQLQPGRCSGGSPNPFMAEVYNRTILPPTEKNRIALTGTAQPPPVISETLGDDLAYYRSGYGDIVVKDYAAMYPNINPQSSDNLYG